MKKRHSDPIMDMEEREREADKVRVKNLAGEKIRNLQQSALTCR